jgi:hypothetical protein
MVEIYELDTAYFPPKPRMGATCVRFVLLEDVKRDLAELLNNLNDDLSDSDDMTTYNDADKVKAIKKYTLKVLKEKYKVYCGK